MEKITPRRTFKAVMVGALVLFLGFSFFVALGVGLDKQEIVDCYAKQAQYANAPLLYSDWEQEHKEQSKLDNRLCNYHHIDLHAGTTTPPENR